MRRSAGKKMAQLARATGIEAGDDAKAAQQFILAIKELSARLEIPVFKDLGIGPETFELIADMSFRNNSNPSNPRPLAQKDYMTILQMAYTQQEG